jgi:hypothetical protein
MASGWHNEPRRHALASKGIKTSITKPINSVMNIQKFSSSNDNYAEIDDIKNEIEPMIDFLQARVSDRNEEATISLDVSYNDFKKFYPEIKKKDLIKLFDNLDEKRRETYFALEELKKEGKRPGTIIKTIQNL